MLHNIYRNAILTLLKLFVKYIFEKNNENREEVAWFFTPQEDQIKTTVCLALYKWAVHTTVCVPVPLYKYISYIKCNVVTLYERILTCLIIYRYAISTFLTLFVKYVFEKKYKFYAEKIMKIEKRLRDFLHLQEDQIKTTYKMLQDYKSKLHHNSKRQNWSFV
jgi:hypothetical protein